MIRNSSLTTTKFSTSNIQTGDTNMINHESALQYEENMWDNFFLNIEITSDDFINEHENQKQRARENF